MNEQVLGLPVPPGFELDWLVAVLVRVAAALGAGTGVSAGGGPEAVRSTDDLGLGEYRSSARRAWRDGGVEVTAEVAEHQIYDGATPSWTVLRGDVAGLPGGATVSVSGTLRAGCDRVVTVRVRAAGELPALDGISSSTPSGGRSGRRSAPRRGST